jgi:hypothetical protein
MKSPGTLISPSRAQLAARVATVTRASRAIRSEVALAICESSEMRIASRQLRMDSAGTIQATATGRRGRPQGQAQRSQRIALAIAQVLSSRGYSVFVTSLPQETASVQ